MDVGHRAARHDGGLGDAEGVDVRLGDDAAQDIPAADDVNQHANTIANRSDQQVPISRTAIREDAKLAFARSAKLRSFPPEAPARRVRVDRVVAPDA
jgi:hypothetical protein